MTLHAFTSITTNYLPKARLLAHSLKAHQSGIKFHLVLCDQVPVWLNLEHEPFDSLIQVEDLPIPDVKGWIFQHSRVELCTGVKGYAFLEIMKRYQAEKVFYFDPDIVVLSSIDCLSSKLDNASIVVTPHQTVPEVSLEAIIDNEIGSLKHGIYNLGFLAVKQDATGLKFLNWWKDRLHKFCYDDIPGGLFTDQRWVDLAIAYFEDIHIAREPIYNLATWNLSNRQATGSLDSGIKVKGNSLVFFHFSGLDTGDQKIMLKKYIGKSTVLNDLRRWYLLECDKMGQAKLGKTLFGYSTFDNGEPIHQHQQLLYRTRIDLQKKFCNPFTTEYPDSSYYHWYQAHVPVEERENGGQNDTPESLRFALAQCRTELNSIRNSLSWNIVLKLHRIYRFFKVL